MASISYIRHLDKIRRTEYPQLSNTVYLDHAGTTLYANSLVDSFAADMKRSLFGNPHSACPSSKLSSDRVDYVRSLVLDYFKADPEYFDVVFVANATAAIKTVMHGFETRRFWYGYHKDAHTSLVGVRELANAGSMCFASDEHVNSWIQHNSTHTSDDDVLRLVAWPAQSNLTGYRPPFKRWAKDIRQSEKFRTNKTYTLLDAASYVCTGNLDLSDHESAPDFTAMSFYKIFGFPDLGALIVRKVAGDVLLTRPYFGGGTVDMVVGVDLAWHAMKTTSIHDVLEDGTLPFHNIVALRHAIEVHKRLFGSPVHISRHVSQIGEFAFYQLSQLQHYNGLSAVHIYKEPNATFGDSKTQGSVMSMNICDSAGRWIGKSRVEKLAIACGLQFRTGGVCNPGGIATMLELKPWEMRRNFSIGMTCGDDLDVLAEKPTGVVRISFGAMTSFQDIDYFVRFVQTFFVEESPMPLPKDFIPYEGYLASKKLDSRLSRRVITPIEGLPSCTVSRGVSKSSEQVYTACSVWDKEWCLLDMTTWEQLSMDVEHVSQMNVATHLDPERGTLTITSSSKFARKHFSTNPNMSDSEPHESIIINLWQLSIGTRNKTIQLRNSEKQFSSESENVMVYSDPEVQAFFSSLVNTPCTLARFIDRHKRRVKKESQTCAVWWCKMVASSAQALEDHYNWHNTEWRKANAVRSTKPQRSVHQLFNTNRGTVEDRSQTTSTASFLGGIRRRIRDKFSCHNTNPD